MKSTMVLFLINKIMQVKIEDLVSINYCCVHLIFNEFIKFREDITDLRIIIDRLDYAFDNNFDEKILCLSNLPNLQNLEINCFYEYNDN
jgi:hypothetical protein